MTEPPPASRTETPHEHEAHARSLSITLASLIFPAALLGGLAGAASFLAQTTSTADAVSVTLLVAAIALAEAAGSAAATRVPAGGARHQGLLAGLGVVLFATGLAWPPACLAVVPALSLLDGLARPLRATLIQRVAADGARARMASLASACDMAVSTISLPLAGLASNRR